MKVNEQLRAAVAAAPLCRGLRGEEIDALLEISEVSTFPSGSVIFREGDKSDALYLVTRGEVAVTKGSDDATLQLGTLPTSSVFGHTSLLADGTRSVTATASGEVQVVAIPAARFRDLLASETIGAFKVMANLAVSVSRRLVEMNEHVARILENQGPDERSNDLAEFRQKLLVDWGF